jgi:hypothetical protein
VSATKYLRLRAAASASPEPHDIIKEPDPYALSGEISASLDPFNMRMGAPDPLGILLPHPRDTWSPLSRQRVLILVTHMKESKRNNLQAHGYR